MPEANEKGSIIHNAFEGVESPENYSANEDIEVYRRMLLEKTEAQSDYIQRHIGNTGNVLRQGQETDASFCRLP